MPGSTISRRRAARPGRRAGNRPPRSLSQRYSRRPRGAVARRARRQTDLSGRVLRYSSAFLSVRRPAAPAISRTALLSADASSRNGAAKAQRPTAVIGGRLAPKPASRRYPARGLFWDKPRRTGAIEAQWFL